MTTKAEFEPDYQVKCENCDQSPTVIIVGQESENSFNSGMCGPCMFGEHECIDPDKW